jgi:hypothetical protein
MNRVWCTGIESLCVLRLQTYKELLVSLRDKSQSSSAPSLAAAAREQQCRVVRTRSRVGSV